MRAKLGQNKRKRKGQCWKLLAVVVLVVVLVVVSHASSAFGHQLAGGLIPFRQSFQRMLQGGKAKLRRVERRRIASERRRCRRHELS
jgi:hypothetical protein